MAKWITRREAKSILQVSDSRLSLLARKGRVKRFKFRHRVMFTLESVQAYADSREESADPSVRHGYWVPTPEEIQRECEKIRGKQFALGKLAKKR